VPETDAEQGSDRPVRLPKRFGRNALTGYARTGSTAVINLVMTPVLVAGLGLEAYGIWVLVTSLAAYRDLLQFGFQTATPKYVAEFSALEDHGRLRGSIATSFWFLTGSGLVALVLGLAMAIAFPYLFDVSPELRDSARVLVVVMTLDFALGLPGAAFAGTLMGLQRYDLVNTTLIVTGILQAAAMALVIVLDGGLVPLGIVTVAISLAGQVWRYYLTRRLVPGLSVSPRSADRGLARPFVGLSIWYGIEDAAFIVVYRVDTIIVGLVLGAGAAGVYSVGQRLAFALGQLAQPMAYLFFPHSSELAARGDAAGLRESLRTGTRLILGAMAPLALAMAILAGPIIEIWVGSDFDDAAPVTVFLCATVMVWALTDTGAIMLLGSGRVRGATIAKVVEAIVNLSLSVLLAHLIGLEGVALATLLAAVAANTFGLLPLALRAFGIRIRDFVGPLLRAHALPVAISLSIGLLLIRSDPSTVPALAASAAAIIAVYIGTFAITGLDGAERRTALRWLRAVPLRASR
jgi:O-antigen/teichoic acid export membrane protein